MLVSRPRACVFAPHHGGGLFSLFNKVITCMEIYARVRVDYPPGQTHYKCVIEKNLWEVICHPLRDAPLDGETCDIVKEYPHFQYTGSQAGHLYWRADGWRTRLHKQFQKISLKNEMLAVADSIFPEILPRSIAVIHRGEAGLAREQLTGVLPSVDDMCLAINAVSRSDPVLICADSDEAVDEFRSRLGDRMKIWEELDRVKAGQAPHFRDIYGSDHVRNMFARTLALSRAAHLVHPVSNIATAALYMNPQLAHTFVEVTKPLSKNDANHP